MPDLSLRGQCQEAQRLVDAGLPADAKTMCYRVLESFPRYVAVYAILGQVFVRLGDRDTAADIFGRVLSADPENAPAHRGLAGIYERHGRLEEARWHIERAFEMSPGDPDTRLAMARLTDGVSGDSTPRLELNRATLARLYLRGHLYSKAIWEFKDLLREMPGRVDLRVALCEALWRSRDTDGAASVTQGVLVELPNCLKACLILGRIWLQGDREDEGRALLQRAQTLDPDNQVATLLFGSRSPLPPRVSRVPARKDDLPPLDLPYLNVPEEIEEVPGGVSGDDSAKISAEEGLAPPRREKDPPAVRTIQIHGATVHAAPTAPEAEEDSGKRRKSSPGVTPRATVPRADKPEPPSASEDERVRTGGAEDAADWEDLRDLSLVDLQYRYVIEHPDDSQARLDLARRYRDGLQVDEALEHYEWLVYNDQSLLTEAVADLEFLYRLRPRSDSVGRLLAEARRRERRLPR